MAARNGKRPKSREETPKQGTLFILAGPEKRPQDIAAICSCLRKSLDRWMQARESLVPVQIPRPLRGRWHRAVMGFLRS